MKKCTTLKVLFSLIIGTIFVIGAASCNKNNATYTESYENAARGILGNTTDKVNHKNSSRDGSEYQIKESEREFYKFYLEEKEVN